MRQAECLATFNCMPQLVAHAKSAGRGDPTFYVFACAASAVRMEVSGEGMEGNGAFAPLPVANAEQERRGSRDIARCRGDSAQCLRFFRGLPFTGIRTPRLEPRQQTRSPI